MKTIVNPKEQNALLAQWRGAEVSIWAYHIGRGRMAIRLSLPHHREFLYIVAIASERISGPLRWNNADIAVSAEPPNEWGEVHRCIVDKNAGFELVCSDVVFFLGSSGPPVDPFDCFC